MLISGVRPQPGFYDSVPKIENVNDIELEGLRVAENTAVKEEKRWLRFR